MSAPDDDLRARFAALRGEEAAGAPPPGAMLGARPRRRRWRPTPPAWAGLAAVAVLAAFAGRFAMRSRAEARAAAEVARALGPFYGAWRAPTDALLDTPGRQWLAAVPDIGTMDSLTALRTTTGGQP